MARDGSIWGWGLGRFGVTGDDVQWGWGGQWRTTFHGVIAILIAQHWVIVIKHCVSGHPGASEECSSSSSVHLPSGLSMERALESGLGDLQSLVKFGELTARRFVGRRSRVLRYSPHAFSWGESARFMRRGTC